MELMGYIITLLIVIYCYRLFKFKFNYKGEKRIIMLQKVIFILSIISSIIGAITGNWWGLFIVFILSITLFKMPRKY